MRKAMLAIMLVALLPGTALAAPKGAALPAQSSMPVQITTLGGDVPTNFSDEDLIAANADTDTSYPAGYPKSYNSSRSHEKASSPTNREHQPQADTLPNGQPKYVHIYWFIGGR